MPTILTVLDVETTGLDRENDQLIEICARKFCWESKHQVDMFNALVKLNEGNILPQFIMNLTGIVPETLENGLSEEEAVMKLIDFIGNSIVVGHNVSFDLGFIARVHELKNDFIDTRALSYLVDPNRSASLKNLCEHYEIELVQHHSASFDTLATWHLLCELWNELKAEDDWVKDVTEYKNTLVIDDRGLTYLPPTTQFMFKKVAMLVPTDLGEYKVNLPC